MRNGVRPSDRGNAILSDLPLTEARAFELPLVLQRRVPLAATVAMSAWTAPRGERAPRPARPRRAPNGSAAAGRAPQTGYLLDRTRAATSSSSAPTSTSAVARASRAGACCSEAGFTAGVPPARHPWRHTFHALPRLVLDYILVRDRPARCVRAAQVERLDEHPHDRGPTVFGSDHHPLLARLDLAPRRGRDMSDLFGRRAARGGPGR